MVEVDPLALGSLIIATIGIAAGAGIGLGLMKRKVDDTAERLNKLLDKIVDMGIDSLGDKPKRGDEKRE